MNVWKDFIIALLKQRSVLTLLEVLNVNVLLDTGGRMEYVVVCVYCFEISTYWKQKPTQRVQVVLTYE